MKVDNRLCDLVLWLKNTVVKLEAIEFYVENILIDTVYSIEEFEEVFKELQPFKAFKYQILSDGIDDDNPNRKVYWFFAVESSKHDIKICETLN